MENILKINFPEIKIPEDPNPPKKIAEISARKDTLNKIADCAGRLADEVKTKKFNNDYWRKYDECGDLRNEIDLKKFAEKLKSSNDIVENFVGNYIGTTFHCHNTPSIVSMQLLKFQNKARLLVKAIKKYPEHMINEQRVFDTWGRTVDLVYNKGGNISLLQTDYEVTVGDMDDKHITGQSYDLMATFSSRAPRLGPD